MRTVNSIGYSYTEMSELKFPDVSLTNDIRESHKNKYNLKLRKLLEEE
jgi:hypothetical protein